MTELRPLTLADVDVDVFEVVTNIPATREPFQWFGFATRGLMRQRVLDGETITDDRGQLAITDDQGAFLGDVQWFTRTWGPRTSACWQLGILLLPEHGGQGHGTAAQRLLVDYLFAHTRAERVEAITDVDNAAELAALKRAGFQQEGVLRRATWRDGGWHDMVLFSRLRGE